VCVGGAARFLVHPVGPTRALASLPWCVSEVRPGSCPTGVWVANNLSHAAKNLSHKVTMQPSLPVQSNCTATDRVPSPCDRIFEILSLATAHDAFGGCACRGCGQFPGTHYRFHAYRLFQIFSGCGSMMTWIFHLDRSTIDEDDPFG